MTRVAPEIAVTAHGNGQAALLVVERPEIDELRPVDAAQTAHGNAVLARRGRPFERGNRAASGRKPSLCSLGVPIRAADPRYRRALRQAQSYVNRRGRELAAQCGGTLGAGPWACLATSGRNLAASVVLHELASASLDGKLFAQAAKLGDAARQAELTAIAIAEREAAVRKGTMGSRLDQVRAEIRGGRSDEA